MKLTKRSQSCSSWRTPDRQAAMRTMSHVHSTPSPPYLTVAFSSLAMKQPSTVGRSCGLVTASCLNSSVSSATWPRQSVTPRPCSLSPSTCKQCGKAV